MRARKVRRDIGESGVSVFWGMLESAACLITRASRSSDPGPVVLFPLQPIPRNDVLLGMRDLATYLGLVAVAGRPPRKSGDSKTSR